MSQAGCRIISHITRPPQAVIERFRGIATANIGDCMNRLAAIDAAIRPMGKAELLGTAFTVKVPRGDNLMFHKALDMAQPGDVIMVDAGMATDQAVLGEIMASYCKKRGIAGVVVSGCIRDAAAIAGMDFPVYACGVSPNGPYKNGPGEIGTVITLGGQVVRPGDIIVGDADGVVVVPPETAEEILAEVAVLCQKEAATLAAIESDCSYARPWVNEQLERMSCIYMD